MKTKEYMKANEKMVKTWYNGQVGDAIEIIEINVFRIDDDDQEGRFYVSTTISCYDYERTVYDFSLLEDGYEDIEFFEYSKESLADTIAVIVEEKEDGWEEEICFLSKILKDF